MALAYLELAESKCSNRRGYLRLHYLVQEAQIAFSSFQNIGSQMEVLQMMLARVAYKSTFSSAIRSAFGNIWDLLSWRFIQPKILVSG